MNPKEPRKPIYNKDPEKIGHSKKADHSDPLTPVDSQKKCEKNARIKPLSKSDPRYWLQKNKLRKWEGSSSYCVEIQFRGERHSVSTRKGDKQSASRVAADIFLDLLSGGWPSVLLKYRDSTVPKGEDLVGTVGEWITEAKKVSDANPATFNQYAASLRKIVGDLLQLKKTAARFGPKKGGAAKYREAIDKASLDILSPNNLQEWRIAYVKKANTPLKENSRKTSCNSTIRQARSLFSKQKIVKFLPNLRLPDPKPFEEVSLYPRQNSRYHSKLDAETLLVKARDELSEIKPALYLTLLLSLATGLRRGEIDSLCWHQVDLKSCLIRVEATDVGALKTQDSRGEVQFDPELAPVLQGFKAKAKGIFVIESESKPRGKDKSRGAKVWGQKYRANDVFDELTTWLRNYPQGGEKPLKNVQKPLHELRKECGALITQKFGIFAASQALRHSTVATTAAHYADRKERVAVPVGDWLQPANVISISIQSGKGAKKGAA